MLTGHAPMKPDYPCIGSQKSGTTWLYEMLRLHPDIGFPRRKETHYWDRKKRSSTREYSRLFPQDRISGDITPAYAILPSATIERVHQHNPDARIVYIVRNPIERAWSHALMVVQRLQSMAEGVGLGARLQAANSPAWLFRYLFRTKESLQRGDHAVILQNWWSVFPRQQILVLFYEDLLADPRATLQQCARHIGVNAGFYDEIPEEMLRRRVFESAKVPLPAGLRAFLRKLYQDRILALQRLLDVDLHHWLEEAPRPASRQRHRCRLTRTRV